ncbi:MAG: c-type cytochrome [Anaerolineales bacterium]
MKRIGWLVLLGSLLAGCNLAGDITPPPGASSSPVSLATQVATPTTPVAVEPPTSSPEAAAGEAIYQQRCDACHGPEGLGDGEQAADLSVAPAALADPEIARSAAPAEWYQIVTVGRMDRFMPPFSSLTDQERWDVVAYALSLSHQEAALSEGGNLYQQYCAECHGRSGEGGQQGPSIIDSESYAQSSRSELAAVIGVGVGTMPGFSEELAEEEIWAVTAYVQSLAFDREGAIDETEAVEQEEGSGVIVGQAQNGTSGEPMEAGFEVTIHGFDGQEEVLSETQEVGADGDYAFRNLERAPGRLFVISAQYQGVRYSSEVLHFAEESDGELQLPITVYETTSDVSAVQAGRVHILIDQPSETGLRIVELWVISNSGQRTVVPGEEDGVRILLPEEATDLRFEDSLLAERYNPVEGGFQLAEPLRPSGQGAQIVFSYQVPFEGTTELSRPLTMPVSAVTVLIADGGPQVEAEQVVDRGQRQAGGENFHQYDLPSREAGQQLVITLQGPSFWSRLAPDSLDLEWVIGGLVFLLALAATLWWYRPWISAATSEGESIATKDRAESERQEWLVKAIADLDEAFEAGKVEEAAYRRRRQELKEQLIDLMQRQDD